MRFVDADRVISHIRKNIVSGKDFEQHDCGDIWAVSMQNDIYYDCISIVEDCLKAPRYFSALDHK